MSEYEFEELARYNAEVSRGLVHTEEWRREMAEEQRRFDYHQTRRLMASVVPPPKKWWRR